MPNYVANGAISGGASGAGAGMNFGPWGAVIGGVAGAGMGAIGGLAQGRAADRAAALRHRMLMAQRQINGFENADNAQNQALAQRLSDARFQSYGDLAHSLSGPERAAAGAAAGQDEGVRLDAAMGAVNMAPVGNRAMVGGTPSWGNNVAATHAPVLDARRALLMSNATQGGLDNFDRAAYDRQQNTGVDISRQAQEQANQSAVLAALRRKMLAEAGVRFADIGPTNGELNQQMLSQLGLAGMQVAGSYGAVNRQNAIGARNYENLMMRPTSGGYFTQGGA